jgi:membrane associated rhomboid family serine protease
MTHNFFEFEAQDLYELGGLTGDGNFIRTFSSMFMHVGIIHIALNMYALHILGQVSETILGKFFFVLSYVFTGLAGGVAVILFTPENTVTIGASGAIFGIMGVLLLYGLLTKAPWVAGIMPAVIINVMYTFVGGNISVAGHFGGLISGAVVGAVLVWRKKEKQRQQQSFAVYDAYYNQIDTKKPHTIPTIVVLIVTGVLVVFSIAWSYSGDAKYRAFLAYRTEMIYVFYETGNLQTIYNEEVAEKDVTSSQARSAIENKLIPGAEENIELAKDIEIKDKELREIHEIFIEYLETHLEIYETLEKAFEDKNSQLFTSSNTLWDSSNDIFERYSEKLLEYNDKVNA